MGKRLNKPVILFLIIYSIILIFELIFDNTESLKSYHYLTKPLLVSSLIIFFLQHNPLKDTQTKQIVVSALLFSLLGDILLMFTEMNSLFFIGGLLAFLIAHVMYILVFLKKINITKKTLKFALLLLFYTIGIFYLLKDGLGNLFIPVIIYMFVILMMFTTAFLREGRVSKNSYNLVFFGAIFFIISDSLLALNKFYSPLPLSGIWIMTTYSIAQLLIVLGLKKQ
ncbi:MAG TPA: lysoplasmalogenase [Yeosuana sp.]